MQQQLLVLLGELLERCIRIDLVDLAHRLEQAAEVLRTGRGPWGDRTLADARLGVGDHELRVDLEVRAETVAVTARAVGRVEREVAGREFLIGEPTDRTAEVLGEGEDLVVESRIITATHDLHLGDTLGDAQGRLERIGETAFDAVLLHEAIDDDLDGVLFVTGEFDLVGELVQFAVDDRASESLAGEIGEQRVVGALSSPDHRRQHLEPSSIGQLEHPIDDLLGGLTGDHRPVVGTVRHPDARIQQAQVVVDLGDGPDGGARIARGRLLVDRDRRGETLDEIDVGLVHLAEELPGVGRQRLHVATLALGVDGVEGQRGLPRSGQAGEDDQPVPGELDGDVAQVVFARTAHHELIHGRQHRTARCWIIQ